MFVFFILLGTAVLCSAHGIHVDYAKKAPFVVVSVKYSGDKPVPGTLITVQSPEVSDPAYQTGHCDRSGRFIFRPDRSGDWKIRADDQGGHVTSIVVSLDEEFFASITEILHESGPQVIEKEVPYVPMLMKILFGLGIIFGLTGLFYWRKAGASLKSR